MFNTLKKIRRTLVFESKEILKKNNELLWASVFNNTIKDSSWLTIQSFSPGRWAVGYPALYILYRIYNDMKPKRVLEFGLGESSKLLYQYANQFNAEYLIVEHDKNWIDFFVQDKAIDPKNILVTTLSHRNYKNKETRIYDRLLENIEGKKFDLIIIDGPFGSEHYSRSQILDIIEKDQLAEDFVILMDDYNREGEKQTVEELKNLLCSRKTTFYEGIYSGEKDCIIICNERYSFLCTL